MKEIQLKFDKSRTTASGNDYGRDVYKKQVSPFVDTNKKIVVFIPDNIEVIGMSFAQGFIHDLAEEYGAKNVSDHLEVKSNNARVCNKFKEAIEDYD